VGVDRGALHCRQPIGAGGIDPTKLEGQVIPVAPMINHSNDGPVNGFDIAAIGVPGRDRTISTTSD
jgi:hypothetical protein